MHCRWTVCKGMRNSHLQQITRFVDLLPAEWWFPSLHKVLLFAEGGIGDGVRVDQVIALLHLLTHLIVKCPTRTIQLWESVIAIGLDACVYAGRVGEDQSGKVHQEVNAFWLTLCQLQPQSVWKYLGYFYAKLEKEVDHQTLQIRKEDVYDIRSWLREAFLDHAKECNVCADCVEVMK